MKKNRLILIGACIAGVFLSSCTGTDTRKELNFNNYTGVDTEAFNFLKQGHYQARFQVYAADEIQNAALAQELKSFYGEVVKGIEEIALADNVIVPDPGDAPFESAQPQESPAAVDSVSTDSLTVAEPDTETEVTDYFAKTLDEQIIHSQEKLIHLTEYGVDNTNVRIREYCREILPKMKDLLEKSQAALK